MTNSTLLIIGAAVVLLLVLLFLLARSGRKPAEGTAETDIAITHRAGEPLGATQLPEPGSLNTPTAGFSGAELAEPLDPVVPLTPRPAEARPFEAEPIEAGPPDELTRLKGLGPKAEARLNALGITRYDQIARWSEADVARIDAEMGPFRGRIARDRWIEQAKLLAAGDIATYEATFGKLG